MSNAEHAIENALYAIERGVPFETWARGDQNLPGISATPEEVWEMAEYVIYTRCMNCEWRPETITDGWSPPTIRREQMQTETEGGDAV